MDHDQSIRFMLGRVMHLYLKRGIEKSVCYDVNVKGGGLLYHLRYHDGVPQKVLADKMGMKPPSITVLLKKLEKSGHIIREQDKVDQRITRIHLTEKGRVEADKMEQIFLEVDKQTFQNITEEEMLLLRRLLMQMKENLTSKDDKEEEHFPVFRKIKY